MTYSGWLTHISGHPSATSRAQDSESTSAKDQCSTAAPRNQGPGERCKLPSTAPEEVYFGVFWGFRNHHFLSTTHYSPVVVLLSLGVPVFGQVGLKSPQGRPKPEQVGLSPLPVEPPSLQSLHLGMMWYSFSEDIKSCHMYKRIKLSQKPIEWHRHRVKPVRPKTRFGRVSSFTAFNRWRHNLFTARRNARIASAVLAIAIPSVRPSVRHKPVLCQNDGT